MKELDFVYKLKKENKPIFDSLTSVGEVDDFINKLQTSVNVFKYRKISSKYFGTLKNKLNDLGYKWYLVNDLKVNSLLELNKKLPLIDLYVSIINEYGKDVMVFYLDMNQGVFFVIDSDLTFVYPKILPTKNYIFDNTKIPTKISENLNKINITLKELKHEWKNKL